MIGLLQNKGRAGRSDWRTLKLTAVGGSPNLLSVTIGRLLVRNIKTRHLASSQKTHSAISPVTTSFAGNVLDFADRSPKCDVAYFLIARDTRCLYLGSIGPTGVQGRLGVITDTTLIWVVLLGVVGVFVVACLWRAYVAHDHESRF
jgi:hypothetical protein